ncbi:MAG: hypothetical protein H8E62_02050 [Planctomycetes bacterium]|nr:hypothetical protein [Planctomycetota bacterium]
MINLLNSIADKWFLWQIAMLWQTAVLIAIVWTADLLIRKWAWPQVRYALWMLVLVKLLIPPTFTSPASVTSHIPSLTQKAVQIQFNPAPQTHETKAVTGMERISSIEQVTAPINTEQGGIASAQAEAMVRTNNTPPAKSQKLSTGQGGVPRRGEGVEGGKGYISWKVYSMFTWLAGIVVLSMWLIVRLSGLRKEHLTKSSVIPAQAGIQLPERFYEQLQAAGEKLNLKRLPKVILTDKVSCPAVFGIFRPILLMPAEKFKSMSARDTEHILLHELAHIKRGDLLVHAVYMILQIAYWFNPLLWMIRKTLQNLRELCCDATVAKLLREDTVHYRQTLLETARQLLAEPVDPGLGLLGLFENSNWLVTRLQWLEKKTWKNRPLRIATIILLVSVMTTCVLPMGVFNPGPPGLVIKGVVTDVETGEPIAGAKVGDNKEYNKGKFCTVTDTNGNYEYKTWHEEHDIAAEASGYQKEVKDYSGTILQNEKERIFNFSLVPEKTEKQDSGNFSIIPIQTIVRVVMLPDDDKKNKLMFDEAGIVMPQVIASLAAEEQDSAISTEAARDVLTTQAHTFLDEAATRSLLQIIAKEPQAKLISAPTVVTYSGESAEVRIYPDAPLDSGQSQSSSKGLTIQILPSILHREENIHLKVKMELTPELFGQTDTQNSTQRAQINTEFTVPKGSTFLAAGPIIKADHIIGNTQDPNLNKRILLLITPQVDAAETISLNPCNDTEVEVLGEGRGRLTIDESTQPTSPQSSEENSESESDTSVAAINQLLEQWFADCRQDNSVEGSALWHPVNSDGDIYKETRKVLEMEPGWRFDGVSDMLFFEDEGQYKAVGLSGGLKAIDDAFGEKSAIQWDVLHLDDGQWKITQFSFVKLAKWEYSYRPLYLEKYPQAQAWKAGNKAVKDVSVEETTPSFDLKTENFTATLPNGVTVELVGLCDFDFENQQCWQPDGNPIAEPIFVTVSKGGNSQHNKKARGFIVKTDIPCDIRWLEASGQTGSFCCSTVIDKNGKKLGGQNYYGKQIWLDGREQTSLPIKIAPTKWRTRAVYDGKYIVGQADKRVRFIETYDSAEGLKVVFQSDFDDLDIRLDALVKGSAQSTVTAETSTVTDSEGNKNNVGIFKNMGLSQIRNFQFKTRSRMEIVTFKNVSLAPHIKTDLQDKKSANLFDGLLAHWAFDEGSGKTISDSTGNHQGSVYGAEWTAGKIGGGLNFDGVDDRVETSLNLDQSGSVDITMAVWIYPTHTGSGRQQIIGSDNGGFDWSLVKREDRWEVFTGRSNWDPGFSVDIGQWQHIAVVFKPGKDVIFYKNGVSNSLGSAPGTDVSDNNITIGDNPGWWDEFFRGKIDDILIFERALSAQEIKQLYENRPVSEEEKSAPNPQGLVEWGIDLVPADFEIRFDSKRQTYNLVVSIENQSDVAIPKHRIRYYRGDGGDDLDETGNQHSGWHEAGPIEPGKTWNESSRGFSMPDGDYTFTVVLDYDDAIGETNEANNRATLDVTIKNGQVVER